MRLRHSARSDVGQKRDHNEDDFGVGEGSQVAVLGGLFIVCDGMGGHAAGEVASRIAVETVLSSYYGSTLEGRENALEQAFEQANQRVYTEGRGSMGTTGVAALFYQGKLFIANVGDSRAYLIHNQEIQQLSVDHSLVGDQLAAGLITPEEARGITYRNVITRALGHLPEVEVDIFASELQENDIIALSSDGLHGLVEDQELAAILSSQPLAQAVEQLVDLANERGGIDNITLLAIQVEDVESTATLELIPLVETDPDTSDIAQTELGASPSPMLDAALPATETEITQQQPAQERRLTMLSTLLASSLVLILIAIIYIGRASPGLEPVTPGMIIPATSTSLPTATPEKSPSAIPATEATGTSAPATAVPATAIPIVPTSTSAPTLTP